MDGEAPETRLRELEIWRRGVDSELALGREARATYIPMLLETTKTVNVLAAKVGVYAAIGGALAGIATAVISAIIITTILGS